MAKRKAATKSSKPRSGRRRALDYYWERTTEPLPSLIFLIPLLVIYEVGVRVYASDSGHTVQIYARTLLRDFFELFGTTSYYLPSFIVVAALLTLHFTRKKRAWKFEPGIYGLMWVESLILALPLFGLLTVLARLQLPSSLSATGSGIPTDLPWQGQIALSVGAGIYEELLFRLMLIMFIHLVVVELLKYKEDVGLTIAVIVSAVAFALYHFNSSNPFAVWPFVEYCIAGAYFGVIFILRGFGICVGVHALYDVMVAVTALMWHR